MVLHPLRPLLPLPNMLHSSTLIEPTGREPPNLNLGQKSDPWHEYGRSQRYADTVRLLIDDLAYLGEVLFPHAFKLESAEIHPDFAEIATNLSIKYPIIETFRESAKSTYFAAFLPVWHAYCEPFIRAGLYPKTRAETLHYLANDAEDVFIVVLSKSSSLAKQRLRTFKRLHGALGSTKKGVKRGRAQLVAHFGRPSIGINPADEMHWQRGVFKSLGGSQPGHGLQEEFDRITLGLVDDAETEENTKTEAATQNNYDVIMNGIQNGLAKPNGRMPVLATPIRHHSFVRRCKALADSGTPGYHYFHHPLLVDEDGKPPARIPTLAEYDAELVKTVRSVWEAKNPIRDELATLDGLRKAGAAHSWYLSRQCQIRADEETKKFPESSIQLYDGRYFQEGRAWFLEVTHLGPFVEMAQGSPYLLDKPQVVPVNLYTGMDDSQGVKRDYAVKLTRAFDGKRHFIHSIIRSNSTGPEGQVLWLVHGHEGQPGYLKLREKAIMVEKVFLKNAMERVLREMGRELGIHIPIVASPPKSAKAEKYRASSIYADFHNKLVYFRREHRRSITTFVNYDATIEHQPDDDIDAYELSRQRNYTPRHTTATKPTIVERRSRPRRSALESWKLPRSYT